MKGSKDTAFKNKLKSLILEETERDDLEPAEVPDDQPLFGPGSALELDSIDGLQVSMALEMHYNVKITDPKELRRVMADVNTLADFLQPS